MNRILQDFERQFSDASRAIRSLVTGLSEEELQWRSSDGRWSIVECLDHLNAGWLVLPRLDRKIGQAGKDGPFEKGRFRDPWLGRLYVRLLEPPVKLRLPAPRKYRPRREPPSSEVVPRLLTLQDELIARLRSADGLDLGRIRMSSPISRRFQMTLAQWFALLAAHERRHLWQAENVKREMRGMTRG